MPPTAYRVIQREYEPGQPGRVRRETTVAEYAATDGRPPDAAAWLARDHAARENNARNRAGRRAWTAVDFVWRAVHDAEPPTCTAQPCPCPCCPNHREEPQP